MERWAIIGEGNVPLPHADAIFSADGIESRYVAFAHTVPGGKCRKSQNPSVVVERLITDGLRTAEQDVLPGLIAE
jgi:hypothetical protein